MGYGGVHHSKTLLSGGSESSGVEFLLYPPLHESMRLDRSSRVVSREV